MKGAPEELNNTVYKLATEGYWYELKQLIRAVKSPDFREILSILLNYEHLLYDENQQIFGLTFAKKLLKSSQTITVTNNLDDAGKLFRCTNMAAFCEIFSGWTIPVAELEMSRTNEYLQLALNSAGTDKSSLGRSMAVRLNQADTARVVHTLKLLGLLRVDTHTCNQLSLCCSVGERDREALHHMPYIKPAQQTIFPTLEQLPPLNFGTDSYTSNHIVMIDNDSALKSVYKQINDEENNILAINQDLYEGLEELAGRIKSKQLDPINLVVSFRLAPEGFPDVKRFIHCLGNVISEEADFLVTIGAGDNLAEFKHRQKVMNQINEELSNLGMMPVRIKNYKGKTPHQQQRKLIFGLSQYASYETIFCKLKKRNF